MSGVRMLHFWTIDGNSFKSTNMALTSTHFSLLIMISHTFWKQEILYFICMTDVGNGKSCFALSSWHVCMDWNFDCGPLAACSQHTNPKTSLSLSFFCGSLRRYSGGRSHGSWFNGSSEGTTFEVYLMSYEPHDELGPPVHLIVHAHGKTKFECLAK